MVQQHQENLSFAIKLAQKINGEIVNADSMQVYKELKIITARPLIEDQKNQTSFIWISEC